jgi:hypothetical protein
MKPSFAAACLPFILLLIIFATPALISAQQTATITMALTNPQIAPPEWKLSFDQQGHGQFDAAADPSIPHAGQPIVLGEIHESIQLSPEFTAHAFQVAHQRKLFNIPCESRLKVAFQGNKRFTYFGPDGSGSCEFNYSKDKTIQDLSDAFLAIENTLLYGARLEKLMQHDHLGLDQEMEDLATAVHNGTAIEVGVIRGTLTRIAGDEKVLERARRKARLLLAQAH